MKRLLSWCIIYIWFLVTGVVASIVFIPFAFLMQFSENNPSSPFSIPASILSIIIMLVTVHPFQYSFRFGPAFSFLTSEWLCPSTTGKRYKVWICIFIAFTILNLIHLSQGNDSELFNLFNPFFATVLGEYFLFTHLYGIFFAIGLFISYRNDRDITHKTN